MAARLGHGVLQKGLFRQETHVLPLPVWPYTMMVTLNPDSAALMSCVMPHMRMTSPCRAAGPRHPWKEKSRATGGPLPTSSITWIQQEKSGENKWIMPTDVPRAPGSRGRRSPAPPADLSHKLHHLDVVVILVSALYMFRLRQPDSDCRP